MHNPWKIARLLLTNFMRVVEIVSCPSTINLTSTLLHERSVNISDINLCTTQDRIIPQHALLEPPVSIHVSLIVEHLAKVPDRRIKPVTHHPALANASNAILNGQLTPTQHPPIPHLHPDPSSSNH